jgi:hypothetical protein
LIWIGLDRPPNGLDTACIHIQWISISKRISITKRDLLKPVQQLLQPVQHFTIASPVLPDGVCMLRHSVSLVISIQIKIMQHRGSIFPTLRTYSKIKAIPNYSTALLSCTFILSTRSLLLALTVTFTTSIALVSASSSTSVCTAVASSKVGA